MDNDVLLAVIIVLGAVLLFVTAYMEWIGVMNLFTPRSGPRYDECGHLKVIITTQHGRCFHCRHQRLEHALHLPVQHPHQEVR